MDDTDQHEPFPDALTIGPPNLYNLSQAAKALGLGRKTVRALVGGYTRNKYQDKLDEKLGEELGNEVGDLVECLFGRKR